MIRYDTPLKPIRERVKYLENTPIIKDSMPSRDIANTDFHFKRFTLYTKDFIKEKFDILYLT